MALKRAVVVFQGQSGRWNCLTSESVQGASLPLEGIDDIHGSDGLPLGVLGVGDGVTDDILQEHLHTRQLQVHDTATTKKDVHLQDTSGLFIDKTTYPLDSSSSCQSSNSRLGDALN